MKKEKVISELVGTDWSPSTEANEVIAAHLQVSPAPDYCGDEALCLAELDKACPYVAVATVIKDGAQEGEVEAAGYTCMFLLDDLMHFTDLQPTAAAAAASALFHVVLSHKSALT